MSRTVSRTLRHTKKSMRIGASLARSAQAAGELAMASGIVIDRRSRMLNTAIGDPLAGANPEFLRMGAEKAVAMTSVGTAMVSSMADMQRTWLNLGFVQFHWATAMTGALLRSGSPAQAAKAVGKAAETALADGVDGVLDMARSGQEMVAGALKPLHRAASGNAKRLTRDGRKRRSA